ncbi:hypothetical protein COOONC_13139 [Cooperia oncophora]
MLAEVMQYGDHDTKLHYQLFFTSSLRKIFINRSLRMDKIKCVGFDMDATLAIYNSPISEELAFNLSTKRLVDIGYPKGLQELKYKKDFVVRNAWFDKRFGNLLKTDEHCNILNAFHGFKKLDK